MNFIARFNMPNRSVPVRAYLHQAGKEMWGPGSDKKKAEAAKDHIIETLSSISKELELQFDYILAVAWGQSNPGCGQAVSNGNKMIDCFGYSGVTHNQEYWPGNPEVEGWVMHDGLYARKDRIMPAGLTCEDSTMMLGKEAEYRRSCTNLREFLQNPPKIPGLEKLIELGV